MLNSILMAISGIAITIILFTMYQRAKAQRDEFEEEDFSSIDKVVEAVKLEMVEIIKEDYSLGLTEKEFNALYKRKARIQDALRNCVYGIDGAKVIVTELIRTFIEENVPEEKVIELLGLGEGQDPSDHVKFEILMYRYKKRYGKEALSEWINKYGFSKERPDPTVKRGYAYYITIEDLHMTYEDEGIVLTKEERLEVLAVLVYQLYKGFGIVDTMREMDVNGFNMGTSGSILSNVTKKKEGLMKANNAVWLYFSGRYIHMRFMNYGTEDELKRIVQLLVRYNNPGPLTAKRGYLVNTMYDKSRILALRPPASEYWAVFVRKFSLSDVSPEALVKKPYVKRADLPINLIEYLMRGQITCAVTGRQGSGKTTLMSSIIRYIDPRYTLRILEMAPELYLRELYPTRNILSVQETTSVSAAELQDALKKSDAAVSIVGEVATDVIAARMIQMGQVASLFTIFSHHANTPKDLVYALRNSLVNAGGFSNMDTAERQVTDVVKVDIHLDYTPDGKRYIARVSEIIPLEENIPYPELVGEDIEGSMAVVTKEYYQRRTDRLSFWTQDIMRYNLDTDTYEILNRFSPALESKIRMNLPEDLREDYDRFTYAEWGRRPTGERDEVADALLERALRKKRKAADIESPLEDEEDAGFVVLEKEDVVLDEYLADIAEERVESEKEEKEKEKGLEIIEAEAEIQEQARKEEEADMELFFEFFDGEVDL